MTDPTLLYWGIGLIAASVLLIVLEVFVPSGGLISILAVGAAIAGVVFLFRHDTTWGLTGTLTVLVLLPLTFAFTLKLLPHTPIGKLMLYGEDGEDAGQRAAEQAQSAKDALHALEGLEGVALTDLYPIGFVEIEGTRREALAEGVMINAGDRVRVSRVVSNQIKVRPIT